MQVHSKNEVSKFFARINFSISPTGFSQAEVIYLNGEIYIKS